MRDIRLGDDIDDFCVRCKRVMNHDVVSVLNGKPAKVRCRTCHSDHDFRNEQPPPPKVDARKAALFQEVLKKVSPSDAPAVDDAELEIGSDAALEGESETEAEPVAEADAEPVEAVEEAPKPKRGRGRPRK
ncbi:MAG: hypothetical protein KGN36_20100 [Acidobacteriota bacterium]|nr:hypothetical protein [Acidobacteriota bacterium]